MIIVMLKPILKWSGVAFLAVAIWFFGANITLQMAQFITGEEYPEVHPVEILPFVSEEFKEKFAPEQTSPLTPQKPPENEDDNMTACTMDAKICPDGSAVGRVGPNCEFAPCPDASVSSGAVRDLSNQGLEKAPGYIFDETFIEVLDLSGNELSGSLQAEVRFLSELKQLDLSDNNFTGVPAEVGQLSKLEILDLSNNELTGLPHELGNLKKLKLLDLRGNNPSQFDLDIITKNLPASTEIRLDGKVGDGGGASSGMMCEPEQRNVDACIEIYQPVCGLTRVECITTPCDPVPATYSNSCFACQDERVVSYTEGRCG